MSVSKLKILKPPKRFKQSTFYLIFTVHIIYLLNFGNPHQVLLWSVFLIQIYDVFVFKLIHILAKHLLIVLLQQAPVCRIQYTNIELLNLHLYKGINKYGTCLKTFCWHFSKIPTRQIRAWRPLQFCPSGFRNV